MNKSTAAIRRGEAEIDAYCSSGSGLHKQRRSLLRSLLRFFVLQDDAALSVKPLKFLRSIDRDDRANLSSSAFLVGTLEYSISKAAKSVGAPKAAGPLKELLGLSERAGVSIRELALEHHPSNLEWASVLDRMTIHVEQRALEDILLASLEFYAVSPGSGSKYTECFGLCFGNERLSQDDMFLNRIVSILRVATQFRAKADAGSVYPNEKSRLVQAAVAEHFFRHLQLVGEYHTHPYKSYSALKKASGWEPSTTDRADLRRSMRSRKAPAEGARFEMIVAVAQGGKTGTDALRITRNRVRFCLDRRFVEIAVYRLLPDGECDADLDLECAQVALKN
jgi:hypothetical protein